MCPRYIIQSERYIMSVEYYVCSTTAVYFPIIFHYIIIYIPSSYFESPKYLYISDSETTYVVYYFHFENRIMQYTLYFYLGVKRRIYLFY